VSRDRIHADVTTFPHRRRGGRAARCSRLRHQGTARAATACRAARGHAGTRGHARHQRRQSRESQASDSRAQALSAFVHRDGELCAERVPLSDIAARFGTPCYVYSRAALESAWREFDAAFSALPHLVCYAMKANSNLAVLDLFARLGSGFDIVSGGELERVLAAGGDPAKVVFSGVGKSETEMAAALAAGILCFNVESASELTRLD